MLIAAVLLVLATLIAYHNSFSGPFVYDDTSSIKENPTINRLSDLRAIFNPPNDTGVTVNGRPFVNLSLAINYAIGKYDVTSYHVVNLIIHVLAGLALFGFVRRTLLLPALKGKLGTQDLSLPLAFATALIWLVHPLQTESVTYIVQRAESLVGMFFLLTFYCFVRSVTSARRVLWEVFTVLSCLCGVLSKEVIATAPVLVLLYDRAVVGGTFAEALKQRLRLYIGLAATWLLLAYLMSTTGNRGGTAGFGAGGISSWDYALTSALAIGKYVKLSFWPSPLVFDYGTALTKNLMDVLPQGLLILAAVGAMFYALWRKPLLGFLGMWFFAILGPSSSIIPIASEPIAEHRMYLPLAALVALVVVGLGSRLGRQAVYVSLGLAVAAAAMTVSRNRDYQSEMALWRDTAAKYPSSARAHNNIGEILYRQEKFDEAISYFREAVRLLPGYLDALNNLGNTLTQIGRAAEGRPFIEEAYKLKPNSAETNNNLGSTYYHLGLKKEAMALYEAAIKLKPTYPDPYNNLGFLLRESGRIDEAIAQYRKALELKPDYVDALLNYGNALNETHHPAEAKAQFERLLKIKPTHAKANNNLGSILYTEGKNAESKALFEVALKTDPNYADALANMGAILLVLGQPHAEAAPYFERALKIEPNHGNARIGLSAVYIAFGVKKFETGDLEGAKAFFERAVQLTPSDPSANNNLGVIYLRQGKFKESLPYLEEAVRVKPDYASAVAALAEARKLLGLTPASTPPK